MIPLEDQTAKELSETDSVKVRLIMRMTRVGRFFNFEKKENNIMGVSILINP